MPTEHQAPCLQVETARRTIQQARDLFVSQNTGHDPLDAWPCPNSATHFLKSCEWHLWQAYKRHSRARLQGQGLDPDRNEFADWVLGFYIKLATSPAIKEICGAQCRSRKHADALLGLLFLESDRVARADRPADQPVFGELMGEQMRRGREVADMRDRRQAKADLRQFAIMSEAIEPLSDCYDESDRNDLRTLIAKHARAAERSVSPPQGPDVLILRFGADSETILALSGQEDPALPRRAGRPPFDHASENTYCELVRRLVKKAYRGPDELERAVELIQHFSPGLLEDAYTADQLAARLKPFLDKPGVRPYLARLEAGFVQNTPLTKLPLLATQS